MDPNHHSGPDPPKLTETPPKSPDSAKDPEQPKEPEAPKSRPETPRSRPQTPKSTATDPTSDETSDSKTSKDSGQQALNYLTKLTFTTALQPINYDKYKLYKRLAQTAQNQRKIFSIIGEGYQPIRDALRRRGWQERLHDKRQLELLQTSHRTLLLKAQPGNRYERVAIARLLTAFPAYFIWLPWGASVTCFDEMQPFKSRLRRNREHDFTLKEGLINCVRDGRWQFIENRAELTCPRSYRLNITEESEEFMQDYRFTGCTSLLGYLVGGIMPGGANGRFAGGGTVSVKCIDFALERIHEMLRFCHHEDLDEVKQPMADLSTWHWREFFKDFQSTVRGDAKFAMLSPFEMEQRQQHWIEVWRSSCTVWPHLMTDGSMNVWIMKPANMLRGIGIVLMADNVRMVEMAQQAPKQRYIAQKYLERPLLIHDTKFDIRQYFLMVSCPTSATMQVWMYKQSYLKFSSQPFSLQSYHQAVHITNHTVQKRYKNNANRHPGLPACNMWSSTQFVDYLQSIGQPGAWSTIYAGMRRNIVAAVRSAYSDASELQRNCFELVGADFMVTDQFGVQLLEVNAEPEMVASTQVTADICPVVLEDCVKVVVDRFNNANADTGFFEFVDEFAMSTACWMCNLNVDGTRCQMHGASSDSGRTIKSATKARGPMRQPTIQKKKPPPPRPYLASLQRTIMPKRPKMMPNKQAIQPLRVVNFDRNKIVNQHIATRTATAVMPAALHRQNSPIVLNRKFNLTDYLALRRKTGNAIAALEPRAY